MFSSSDPANTSSFFSGDALFGLLIYALVGAMMWVFWVLLEQTFGEWWIKMWGNTEHAKQKSMILIGIPVIGLVIYLQDLFG